MIPVKSRGIRIKKIQSLTVDENRESLNAKLMSQVFRLVWMDGWRSLYFGLDLEKQVFIDSFVKGIHDLHDAWMNSFGMYEDREKDAFNFINVQK